jgi:hypothetical protein
MPYICMTRTDIPDGTLQVLDLNPNTSQRNLVYEPPGQTKYIRRADNDTVATVALGGDDVTRAAYAGVAAYLLDHVESGGLAAGTGALTDANANTIAVNIVAAMDAGAAMTLAAVNVLIAATAANSELTNAGGSASTGTLADLLKILAGGEYVVPAGSVTETPTGTFNPVVSGAFTTGQFRHTYDAGALNISLGEGHLADFVAATFEYAGTAGAALVVYSDTGAVMP